MQEVTLSDAEFAQVQALAQRIMGVHLTSSKKALVVGRWSRRLSHYKLHSYRQYLELINGSDAAAELQTALDLLTTNETHFFRERAHFDYLQREVLRAQRAPGKLRVWSAACSSGEEPYSLAMLLASELRGAAWEVLGSDINSKVLAQARAAKYVIERARGIPAEYLRQFCLKGVGPEAGMFVIDRWLRERVQFRQINLNRPLVSDGQFDVILLRNVMIYFDAATKAEVVQRLLPALKPQGLFIVGHCETLNGIATGLEHLGASMYRKALR
jgi:chemotaxis protein methyltransferase CheR